MKIRSKPGFLLGASLVIAVSADAQTGNFSVRNTSLSFMYNNHRAAQADPLPWAGSYFAFRNDGLADREGEPQSPSEKFDAFFRQGNRATAWEKVEHSCSKVPRDMKKSCEGWWGHCNAWAAAAIKHPEPRDDIRIGNTTFGVGDQKAYLTEIWMSSDSLFAGDTDKGVETKTAWVCDPDHAISRKVNEYGSTPYDAFWDMSPRDFFYIFTNYLGTRKQGIVIDRFTGDQVWNQPVVAYRIEDLKEGQDFGDVQEVDGRRLYPVKLTMHIYWANDGVYANHLTALPFDVMQADKLLRTARYQESFQHRELKFTLFTNEPVEVRDGKITNDPRIVGKGIWYNQENCTSLDAAEHDEGHPDFIWAPTTLLTPDGSANPYIESDKVMQILEKRANPGPGPGAEEAIKDATLKIEVSSFPGRTSRLNIRRLVKAALTRAGIKHTVDMGSFTMNTRTITMVIKLKGSVTAADVSTALSDAGITATVQ